ncbi:MAG: RidA family protein [Alistipes sp.]|nr:RidA family protein [Alistipes sp.]
MKNFVKHTLAIAICAAALLSSCIKEENFRLDTVELTVTLTRADSESPGSQEQGDAINDVMIWAFPCKLNNSGAPTLDGDTKATGFTYATGLNLYQSISVHVPLTVCDGEQSYVVVAVINSLAFDTTISAFGAGTTWGALKSATFAKSGDFWTSYPKVSTPGQMPISNWATLTIKENNTHSNNQCYQLNLPVHRAVAKTQLYMSKAGQFGLKVLDAKVVANNGYSNGAVLTASAEQSTGSNSEAIQRGKPSEASTTWWWASPKAITRAEGATDPAVTYQLKNSVDGFTTSIETSGSTTNPGSGDFTWVASTFLLENDNEADYGVGVYDEPQGDGYNLYVKYQVDGGEPVEVYTPLGKVVRNHDYQVKATVDAGGELTFTIEVVDWVEEEIEMNYENTVTIADNGYINWTTLPEKSNSVAELVNGKVASGQIDLTYEDGATAKCTFALQTPQYGTWHAELRTLSGVTGNIVFVDRQSGDVIGTSTKGDISGENGAPQQAELIIKNVGNNLATGGSTGDNVVELRIYATGIAGVYQIPNLPGVFDADGVPEFAYYKLTQPRN